MTLPKVTVKLDSPASIAACVPSLLGFIPADQSLVVVSMVGKRVGMVARVDGPPLAAMERLARQLHGAMRHGEPDLTGAHVIGWETATGYADELYWALDRLGVPVLECLTVQDGRVLDTCRDETNPRWVDLPEDVVRPAAVYVGDVVAGSREELAQRIGYTGVRLVDGAEEIAERIGEIPGRDAAIAPLATLDGEELGARMELFAGIARAFQPGDERRDAALCLMALCAWLRGNGAMASVALDACTPTYSLAQLLRMAHATALNPDGLRTLIAQL